MARADQGKRIPPKSAHDSKGRRKHSCSLARRVNRSKSKASKFRRALELQCAEGMEQRAKQGKRRSTGAQKRKRRRVLYLATLAVEQSKAPQAGEAGQCRSGAVRAAAAEIPALEAELAALEKRSK